jgi:hypothetical protein
MNPAVLNYLQSQQQPNQMNMEQAPQQQAPYNPFDSGISKAISSARESLGMTDKQQEKALRRSMLTFGDNIAQQPKQKGFWNNFGSVGRALSPAIMAHDDAEDTALTQNNALANQILAYQAAEQKRQADAEQQAWERQHKEAILGETRRAHDMANSRVNAKTSSIGGGQKGHGKLSENDLEKTLNMAEQTIDEVGDKGFRGRSANFFDKFVPGGIRLNEDQSKINTLGDILKGKLFNSWGYRNQAEFEHVPTISSTNPPEVNKAIIKQLKEILLDQNNEEPSDQGESGQNFILMQDQNGQQIKIPANDERAIEDAIKDGFNEV